MRRHFLVDEIMFDGISGEIRGVVSCDRYTGEVESIDCQTYRFWIDTTEEATFLSESQRQVADALLLRVLESDDELAEGSSPYLASAARFSPSRESVAVLSRYLAQPKSVQQDRSATETRSGRAETA